MKLNRLLVMGVALAVGMMINSVPLYAREANNFLNSADNTEEMAERPGMIGRFYIPDVEINVALFNVNNTDYNTRLAYADAEDSGLWFTDRNMVVIGDHAYQGFDASKDVVPGETLCYVQAGADITAYVCAGKGRGTNITSALLDEDGNRLRDRKGYSFMTYCCADTTGKEIYYTLWIPYVPSEESK